MLLRLHGEMEEAVGGDTQLLSLVFGLFFLHASLSDATSVKVYCQKQSSSSTRGRADSWAQMLLECGANRRENGRKKTVSCNTFSIVLSRKKNTFPNFDIQRLNMNTYYIYLHCIYSNIWNIFYQSKSDKKKWSTQPKVSKSAGVVAVIFISLSQSNYVQVKGNGKVL